jgi:hypothetical protein
VFISTSENVEETMKGYFVAQSLQSNSLAFSLSSGIHQPCDFGQILFLSLKILTFSVSEMGVKVILTS